MKVLFLASLFIVIFSEPTVYFKENFEDGEKWKERWVQSKQNAENIGEFILSHGRFYGHSEKSKGIQTSENNRFYAISAKFKPFTNENRSLVVQFTVKHEQKIDCGGGYMKLFDCSLDQQLLSGDSPYLIMFGPDICGPSIKKVHIIFNYKGKNLLIEKDIRCKDDVYTHLYTLIVKPDNTYIVKIDNDKVEGGELEKDWNFLPPKRIKDPNIKKPADWDDNIMIDDVNDKKPDNWDKPEYIPDPEASKPEDWDDEMDGEWEAPVINNPEYKGEWRPRQIENPNYKGPWIHPEIDNPDYTADPFLYRYEEICFIGLDLWQVKSGSIFDNFLLTDDEDYAYTVGEENWKKLKESEYKMKQQLDEEERKRAVEQQQNDDEDIAGSSELEDYDNEDDDEDLDEISFPQYSEHDHDEL